jgi:hypothetical protein
VLAITIGVALLVAIMARQVNKRRLLQTAILRARSLTTRKGLGDPQARAALEVAAQEAVRRHDVEVGSGHGGVGKFKLGASLKEGEARGEVRAPSSS